MPGKPFIATSLLLGLLVVASSVATGCSNGTTTKGSGGTIKAT
jgi:predicted small secreted protein